MTDRMLFDAESGGNTGGDTSTGEGQQPGATQPPVTEPGEAAGTIKLNSAQLAERLERAKTAERDKLLKDLGYGNQDEIKAAIEAGKKALDAQKSEQERQAEALKKAQEITTALEARAKQAETMAQDALIKAEVLGLMSGKFANPKAAIKLLDLSDVKIKDGVISGIEAAVEKLAKDEPWALAQPDRKTPPQRAPGAANPTGENEHSESDVEKRSRYFGNVGGGADFFKGGGLKVHTGGK